MISGCRILVPCDFSAASYAALDYASFLAVRVGGGAIDILHTWDPREARECGETTALLFADSPNGAAMIHALTTLERRGGIELRGRLEAGELFWAILRVARSEHFDLIVMGGPADDRPPSSRRGEPLDSLTHSVARSVNCPVLSVPASTTDERRPPREAPRPSATMRAFAG